MDYLLKYYIFYRVPMYHGCPSLNDCHLPGLSDEDWGSELLVNEPSLRSIGCHQLSVGCRYQSIALYNLYVIKREEGNISVKSFLFKITKTTVAL